MSKIEIGMSDRAPIRVDEGAWPVIARAEKDKKTVAVREHADGRRIVYGMLYEGAPPGEMRAGFIVEKGGDTVRAIRRVAGVLGDAELGAACIAELPAEDLT